MVVSFLALSSNVYCLLVVFYIKAHVFVLPNRMELLKGNIEPFWD